MYSTCSETITIEMAISPHDLICLVAVSVLEIGTHLASVAIVSPMPKKDLICSRREGSGISPFRYRVYSECELRRVCIIRREKKREKIDR